jgi:diamine N-acetyltransferase
MKFDGYDELDNRGAVAAITLARASADDAAAFAGMEQEADTEEYIYPSTEAEHRRGMQDPGLVYLGIREGGDTIGFIILALEPDGRSVELRRIVVSRRGRGIGQAAITLMEELCVSKMGRTRVWLDVFEHNLRGRHIYEKLGYRKFTDTTHDGKRLLLYEKDL